MEIIELEDSFQLCTRKEYYDALIRVAKQPKKYSLTDVQLEVLSVVAYRQPVTRQEIEKIRGVEDEMDQARGQARAQAQKIRDEADRAGQALLEQSRRTAEEKTTEVMQAAEERGAARRGEILAAAEKECRALNRQADANMALAVEMIVERVVDG